MKRKGKKWTPEQRAKFIETMRQRRIGGNTFVKINQYQLTRVLNGLWNKLSFQEKIETLGRVVTREELAARFAESK